MNTAQKSRYLKELIHSFQYDSYTIGQKNGLSQVELGGQHRCFAMEIPAELGTGERMWSVIPGAHLWTG